MGRTGRLLVVVSLIAGLMAVGGPAQAAEVEYVVTGQVTKSQVSEVVAGDELVLRYAIDPNIEDSDGDFLRGRYLQAVKSWSVVVGSIAGEYSDADNEITNSTVLVGDGLSGVDGYSASALGSSDCVVTNEWIPAAFRLIITDTDGETLDSDKLREVTIEDLKRFIDPAFGPGDLDEAVLGLFMSLAPSCDDIGGIATASIDFDITSVELVATDTDGDGIVDGNDFCAETVIPEPGLLDYDGRSIPTSGSLGVNRYALTDGDTSFDTNTAENEGAVYTLEDTGGCNASQIADALELGKSHYEMGITRSVLESWIAGLNG